jgi:hypothetical protein
VRLRELSESSEFVTINRRLNPKIWQNGEIDSEVADKLKDIADAFVDFIGVDLDIVDVTITGSNANYTWTQYSDLDLHVVVAGEPDEQQRELYNAKKSLWSEEHTITIRGLPVECYIQGDQETHHSTGVYSILHNTWLIEPKKTAPSVDDKAIDAKKDSLEHEIQAALLTKDLDKLRAVKEKIVKMRKAGLERAGEWSTENLAFKAVRNLGLIDQISEKIRELEDQELSLEQTEILI